MQVIGLCRFSYPAEGGFQVEHDRIEDRIAYLYSPARMEERFRHFETICLPGLKAQTDPDFLFVILTGDSLPDVYMTRLQSLVADMPQARVVALPPEPHRQICKTVINAHREPGEICLQFRHDDDDAVGIAFVERLREAARDVAPLIDKHPMVGFDWNRGFVARPGPDGIAAEPIVRPYWGVAQAMAARPDAHLSIMNFGHDRLNQRMPTVTFTEEEMFVRGHNDHNDSRQKAGVKPVHLPLLDAEGETWMKRLFAIDADHVRRVFST